MKEKYALKNIWGWKKGSGVSQMVWRCFVSDKLGPLVCINDTIKKDTYIQLLKENLLPFIDLLHDKHTHSLVFQQDNAKPCTTPII